MLPCNRVRCPAANSPLATEHETHSPPLHFGDCATVPTRRQTFIGTRGKSAQARIRLGKVKAAVA